MKIHEKLMMIQVALKAPKTQYNSFGKYKYRNLEDILNGLKPLLMEFKCSFKIDNDLLVISDKLFRESVATLTCIESGETVSSRMLTQEALEKKGMSPEQCSGSTASYADKYCCNKLFLLDDTADADSMDNRPQKTSQPTVNPLVKEIETLAVEVFNAKFQDNVNWFTEIFGFKFSDIKSKSKSDLVAIKAKLESL